MRAKLVGLLFPPGQFVHPDARPNRGHPAYTGRWGIVRYWRDVVAGPWAAAMNALLAEPGTLLGCVD